MATTEERERAHVAADEVRHALRACRLCVREIRRAEHCDEQLGVDDLAGRRVDDVRLLYRSGSGRLTA